MLELSNLVTLQNVKKPIVLVEFTNNLFTVILDGSPLRMTLYMRSHEYRIVTTAQIDQIKSSTGGELQKILRGIWMQG